MTADIQDLRAKLAAMEQLARRAYPGLRKSGICSRHSEDGHYECRVCYTDWHSLLDEHMKVTNELYEQLLALSGLKDPPNGRIGTNAIVAKLRHKITKSAT